MVLVYAVTLGTWLDLGCKGLGGDLAVSNQECIRGVFGYRNFTVVFFKRPHP